MTMYHDIMSCEIKYVLINYHEFTDAQFMSYFHNLAHFYEVTAQYKDILSYSVSVVEHRLIRQTKLQLNSLNEIAKL